MLGLKRINITAQMLSIIAELDEFKGAWTGLTKLRPAQLKTLKKVSTIESIGSSNRIEGNKLSDREVEELLGTLQKKSFKSRDEEEVAGYAELMNLIYEDYEVLPLSENYLKQLHQILLRHGSKDVKHRGEYKKVSNSVAAFAPTGQEIGIVFETASPFDTPQLMTELVEWTKQNLNDAFYHPLIVIGVFIVHFLAIHPFQDGNGRLSRALTAMLLLQKGYAYTPYSSIESIIELNKESYYRALRRTQKTLHKRKVNYEPWLIFFLTTLQKQKRHLESKIKETPLDDIKLSRLALAILKLFEDKPQLAVREVARKLKANSETVKKSMQTLAANGYIVKHGSTRGVWYERAK
jgi:Fic family protein